MVKCCTETLPVQIRRPKKRLRNALDRIRQGAGNAREMRAHPSRKNTRKREDPRMPAPSHGREERRTRSASRFVRFLLATSPPVSRGVCPRPQAVSPSPHGHRMLVLWSNGPHSDGSCRCARRRPSETPVILVRRPQGTSRPVKSSKTIFTRGKRKASSARAKPADAFPPSQTRDQKVNS